MEEFNCKLGQHHGGPSLGTEAHWLGRQATFELKLMLMPQQWMAVALLSFLTT